MRHTISNRLLSVTVDSLGAQLTNIYGCNTEYLWQGDGAVWADQAPIVFPYVGRLTNGQYRYRGELYSLPMHGFASGAEFAHSSNGPREMCFTLKDSPKTRRLYPFSFQLEISFRLEGNNLIQGFTVENTGSSTMFFGMGGHPGFRVPLEEGLDFRDYRLKFQRGVAPARIGFTSQCFLDGGEQPYPLTEGQLPLEHGMFDQDAIVLRNAGTQVKLCTPKGKRAITVDFSGWPYLGLWHRPNTSAAYLCIEPWSSLPSRQDVVEDLERHSSLLSLLAGGVYSRKIIFTFD